MHRSLVVVAVLVLVAAGPLAAGQRSNPVNNGVPWQGSVEQGSDGCPGSAVASLPYSDSGTTCGFANDLGGWGGAGACTLPAGSTYYQGEDVVYQITLGASNSVTFDLPSFTGDLVLALFSACGDGNTCLQHSADSIGSGTLPETIAASGLAAGTYYLYIDSYYAASTANSCGTYTLNVTGTIPVELVSFTAE